jgi:hypothetical protein
MAKEEGKSWGMGMTVPMTNDDMMPVNEEKRERERERERCRY